MAQGGVVVDRDQFNCSVCLDVLKDPVTIPCGHTYCSECIRRYWDQDEYIGVYACPQCRQTFSPRPLLGKNTMLADVVEKFKTTGLQMAAVPSLAGPEDVECDVCTGRKSKAVKSCTVCLASYCDAHLQPHYESAAFKKHKLMDASKKLQETLCARHGKLLEVYCRTDNQCICFLCLADEHKGHDTVLAETEVQEKQTQLCEMKLSSQQKIQEREKDVQELRQAILSLCRSARAAIEESDRVFTELIRSIEVKRFEVRELLRAQEKTAVSQAEELLEKIQREIAELKKRDAELEKLLHAEDQIHFLQSCHSVPLAPVLENLPSVTSDHNLNFGPVMTAVSDFKGLLLEVCQGGFVSIYETVRDVEIVNSQNLGAPQKPELPAQATPVTGLDQAPVSPFNPFLTPGSTIPSFGGFALSPFELAGNISQPVIPVVDVSNGATPSTRKRPARPSLGCCPLNIPTSKRLRVELTNSTPPSFRPSAFQPPSFAHCEEPFATITGVSTMAPSSPRLPDPPGTFSDVPIPGGNSPRDGCLS